MADCGDITISCPEITCQADMQAAFTELCQEAQTAIDALKACIESYELPECDICAMKDDLVDCPIDCDMVDFTGITYGDEAGVCQLPYPAQVSDLQFRYGNAITAQNNERCGWHYDDIAFDTAFDTQCLGVFISPTAMTGADTPDEFDLGEINWNVKLVTNAGFRVYFILGSCQDLDEDNRRVHYYYMAIGN